MQGLPSHIRQKDKTLYRAITVQGSENYEMLYMSGGAKHEMADRVVGIPADDFNVFAAMVFACADHAETFAALRKSDKLVRHIDVGTGPSLYAFIASLPYADELVSVDLAPANVQRLQAIVDKTVAPAPHWQAWLEIGAILYDIGSAQRLVEIDKNYPDLYDSLRHWPNLTAGQKKSTRKAIQTLPGWTEVASNPYDGIELKSELSAKLRPRLGDAIDDVEPLADLVETADIYTKVFYSESIDNTLEVVAHAETNGIQFAKPGALVVSAHMAKTDGYKGFFTPEELAENDSLKLVEFPASPHFFEVLVGELVATSDRYRILWQVLADSPEERRMVRQGQFYGGIAIVCGLADYKKADGSNKYENGIELAYKLEPAVRVLTYRSGKHHFVLNCLTTEIADILSEFAYKYVADDRESMSLAITKVPLRLPSNDRTLAAKNFDGPNAANSNPVKAFPLT
jgi:hypothetical protein